jgi:hypothetical protein
MVVVVVVAMAVAVVDIMPVALVVVKPINCTLIALTKSRYLITYFYLQKKYPQTSRPSESMTLRASVFTNVRRVFYIFFLSRNSIEIRYKLRALRVINPRARVWAFKILHRAERMSVIPLRFQVGLRAAVGILKP